MDAKQTGPVTTPNEVVKQEEVKKTTETTDNKPATPPVAK
jgi:hypothetical protein